MATVYSSVEGIICPEFQWENREKYKADCDEYREKLRAFCKSQTKCPDAGVIIRFQIADGYAQYMVMSYTKLIHIQEDDAYSIPAAHARGLNKADILQNIKSAKALAELFKPQVV